MVRLDRCQRRWLPGLLIVVLLFTRLLTSAYACPVELAAPGPATPMAQMPGCDGHMPAAMDPGQPLLCQAHCEQGSQNVHPTPASDAPAHLVLLTVLDWAHVQAPPAQQATRATPELASGAPPPGGPPIYLSLLVLRN